MSYLKKCYRCGAAIENDEVFCIKCGVKVQNTNGVKNSKILFVITLVIAIVATIAAIIFAFLFIQNQKIPINTPALSSVVTQPTKSTVMPDYNKYVPAANKKYTYYERYADGDEGEEEVWTGSMGAPVLVSTLLVRPVLGDVTHFIKRTDGIYNIFDRDPNISVMWLSADLHVGAVYSMDGIMRKILKINETCDLSFIKLSNCVVVQEDFIEAEFTQISWYSPGMGCVLETDVLGKYEYKKLTAVEDISPDKVLPELVKYSPNYLKIK